MKNSYGYVISIIINICLPYFYFFLYFLTHPIDLLLLLFYHETKIKFHSLKNRLSI
jgi:hypothetical protein